MHRLTAHVHGNRHRHVLHLELVDRLHAEFGEGKHLRRDDRLGHQVGCTADRHQVDRLAVTNRLDGHRSTLGLADHADQSGLLEHRAGELVHPRRRGRARRSHHLVAHRIHRADVIDEAIRQIDRQALAGGDHVGHLLVCRIAPGKHLARQQQRLTGLPLRKLLAGDGVQVHAPRIRRLPDNVGPGVERRRLLQRRTTAIEHEVGMAGCRAVRDHRHRQARRMRRVVADLDIEHGAQPAEPLGTDAKLVHPAKQLDAQLLDAIR